MEHSFKGVFVDLDGTFIRKDHSVSDWTVEVVQQLKMAGILVVLVSARPLSGMLGIASKAGLLDFPLASLNGAYITQNEEVIFEATMTSALTGQVQQCLAAYPSTLIYYQREQWFSQAHNDHTRYEQRITEVPVTIEPFEDTLRSWQDRGTGPHKMLIISGEKETIEIQERLQYSFGEQLNLFTSKTTYLEVMDKRASKLNAVRMLMGRFGLQQAEIIAIGDNFNDKEMIEFAGLGIAMGNAPAAIRSAADYVTLTNNEDGVAQALTHLFKL